MSSTLETTENTAAISRRGILGAASLGGLGVLISAAAGASAARAQADRADTYLCAYVFRRKPGMTLEEFIDYYENRHSPAMISAAVPHGMIRYVHYPVRPVGPGDLFVPKDGPAFDAISIYEFDTAENAALVWQLPAVAEDSAKFIDFETMIMLPIYESPVFP